MPKIVVKISCSVFCMVHWVMHITINSVNAYGWFPCVKYHCLLHAIILHKKWNALFFQWFYYIPTHVIIHYMYVFICTMLVFMIVMDSIFELYLLFYWGCYRKWSSPLYDLVVLNIFIFPQSGEVTGTILPFLWGDSTWHIRYTSWQVILRYYTGKLDKLHICKYG